MKRRTRVLLVLLTVISCVGCDQTTKAVARSYLSQTQIIALAGGTVRLHYTENRGAFLSLGADLSATARTIIFVVAGAIGLALLFVYLLFSSSLSPVAAIALALIGGGGFSNLIDRVTDGAVIDFLNVGLGSLRTGIFNIADIAITVGVAILSFTGSPRRKHSDA